MWAFPIAKIPSGTELRQKHSDRERGGGERGVSEREREREREREMCTHQQSGERGGLRDR